MGYGRMTDDLPTPLVIINNAGIAPPVRQALRCSFLSTRLISNSSIPILLFNWLSWHLSNRVRS